MKRDLYNVYPIHFGLLLWLVGAVNKVTIHAFLVVRSRYFRFFGCKTPLFALYAILNFCKCFHLTCVHISRRKTWNEEVVLSGDPPEENSTINGKYWTPQNGGCEGMSIIEDPTHKSFTNTSSENDGVPVQDAQVALEMYVRYRKAYPLNGKFKPIGR